MPKVPAVRTPVSADDVGLAILRLVPSVSRSSLSLLLAHWAGETGWGRSMFNFNVGNAKSAGTSGDWTFFSCTEIVGRAEAEKLLSDSRVSVASGSADSLGARVELRFVPDHPWCRFAAYSSLHDGVAAYLQMLQRRFPASWRAALGGDVDEFARALKDERYYTADLSHYVRLLRGTLDMVADRAPQALAAAGGGDVPLPDAAVPRFH